MDIREFFSLKAAGLLHDPPNKAWIIAQKIKGLYSHEAFAKELAEEVLAKSLVRGALDKLEGKSVREADRFSSSVDRWILNILVEREHGKLPYRKAVKLKNIFDPSYEVSFPSPPSIRKVREFAEELGSLISKVSDEKVLWHLLYTLYEGLWIEKGLPAGPADTRVPAHTVFDHSYATVTLLNWFIDGDEIPRGLLLMIDLAGIQKFIKSSRKLRDLWVSSYLVSCIAWRLAWEFIEELGPDVLLIPTCRHNQFYYHSLLAMLKGRVDEKVVQKVKDLANLMSGYNPDAEVYPRSPIIPATLTLLLPDYDVLRRFDRFKEIQDAEGLKRYVEKLYREIWREIYDKTSSIKAKEEGLPEEVEEYARILKDYSRYGFRSVPPLRLRVVIVDVSDLTCKMFEGSKDNIYLLYDLAFKKLVCEASWEKLLKVDPLTEVDLTTWTEEVYKNKCIGYPKPSRRGFDYCTVCAVVPAAIIVDSERLEPYFSDGERLCPYCLLKRLIGVGGLLEKVVEGLLGKKISERKFKIHFPSVSDVASIEFKEELVEQLKKRDLDPEAREKILEYLKDAISHTIRARSIGKEESMWRPQRDLIDSLEKFEIEPSLKELLKTFCVTNSEALYFGEERFRRIWRRSVGKINDILGKFGRKVSLPRSYYALVRSDGDSIGALISGRITESMNLKLEDYLKNLFEGPAREIICHILEGGEEGIEKAKEIAEKEGIEGKKVEEVEKFVKMLREEEGIPVSVAYHVSLSRALMRAAMRDVKSVESAKGVVVYAGGDDLLALAPISQELRIVRETRRLFGLGSESTIGFDSIKMYQIPCLISVGRSYCVYEAHYMYPMYMVIDRSNTLLDNVAKNSEWVKNGLCKPKDSCVVSYSPRGGEEYAILPFNISPLVREVGQPIWMVEQLLGEIASSRFSSSIIYDFRERGEVIVKLAKIGNFEALSSVIDKVFRDNASGREVVWSKYVKFLSEMMKWRRKTHKHSSGRTTFLGIEILKALGIVRSGLRSGL